MAKTYPIPSFIWTSLKLMINILRAAHQEPVSYVRNSMNTPKCTTFSHFAGQSFRCLEIQFTNILNVKSKQL